MLHWFSSIMTKLLGLVVFLFCSSVALTNARAIGTTNKRMLYGTTNDTLSVDDILATYENDSSCQQLNMAYPKMRDSTFLSVSITIWIDCFSFNFLFVVVLADRTPFVARVDMHLSTHRVLSLLDSYALWQRVQTAIMGADVESKVL